MQISDWPQGEGDNRTAEQNRIGLIDWHNSIMPQRWDIRQRATLRPSAPAVLDCTSNRFYDLAGQDEIAFLSCGMFTILHIRCTQHL